MSKKPKPQNQQISSGSSSNSNVGTTDHPDLDVTPSVEPPRHVTALVPSPPKFMENPEESKPKTEVKILSQESSRFGRQNVNPISKTMPPDTRRELPLPFSFTVQGSRRKVLDLIKTMCEDSFWLGGFGGLIRERLLNIAVLQAGQSEPAPNEAVILFMGIEGPATQKTKSTSVVCRIDFKKINLPNGIKDVEELEIEEDKQRRGEPNKLSA